MTSSDRDFWPTASETLGTLSAHVLAFCRLLRLQGFLVGPAEVADALRAVTEIGPGSRADFRLALRTVLVKRRREQPIFDELFEAYWTLQDVSVSVRPSPALPEWTPPSRKNGFDLRRLSLLNWALSRDAVDRVSVPAYSPLETSARRGSPDVEDDLREYSRVASALVRPLATYPSRRYRRARRSRWIDLRRTIRRSLARGGEVFPFVYRQRRIRRPRLIVLCDVSGSMDLYDRFLVRFMYALQQNSGSIETFVFSTRLYRLTDVLRKQSLPEVLRDLKTCFPQWSGGTRIGECLRTFLDYCGDALLNRRAVVVIVSDGWDTGDIELLEACMEELHRRARSIIWLNPLSGSPHYEPTCRGMQAALPYIDLFAPAYDLESLRDLARSLATRRRRSLFVPKSIGS
ncbi:MAG: VWA domain-containing protein [Acidobacteria bacterium]|nr:VWA domain-containing protein [Acidobacteriota bacterium]MDW7983381.1 VWA domain-containing protein [Acidobacteriota bacterium]